MFVDFVESCFELHCALKLPRPVYSAVLSENATELLPNFVAVLKAGCRQKSFAGILAIVLH